MTRKTVLLLTTTFDLAGAELVCIQAAHGLSARDYRVIVGCLQSRSGQVARELSGAPIEILNLGMSSKLDYTAILKLVRFLRNNEVDVVYTFLIHAHLVGRLAARIARVPVLISSQQTMLIENRFLRWANRFTARWCGALVAVSENVKEYLIHDVGVPESKVVMIYNAIDTTRFDRVCARKLGETASGLVIGYCAWLRPEKDHETLITAVKLAKERLPQIRLLLAGDGPERKRLERFVKSEQLDNTVEFLGHVADVASFYSRLHIYVQSSFIEGLPCAILEALACSLPVVATRAGGNEEILGDHEAGVLVECRDPAALAEAIIWITTHPDDAGRMGMNGRVLVRDRFSTRAMITATDELIKTLSKAVANGEESLVA